MRRHSATHRQETFTVENGRSCQMSKNRKKARQAHSYIFLYITMNYRTKNKQQRSVLVNLHITNLIIGLRAPGEVCKFCETFLRLRQSKDKRYSTCAHLGSTALAKEDGSVTQMLSPPEDQPTYGAAEGS